SSITTALIVVSSLFHVSSKSTTRGFKDIVWLLQAKVARRRANLEAKNEDVSNIHKRRERLSRRQTCREVSPDTVVTKVEEIQEEVAPCNVTPAPIRPASVYQTNHGQFIAFTQDGAIQISSAFPGGLQGLQPLPLSNSVKPQSAAAIVQYSQETGDVSQQFFMQGNNVLVQGNVMCYAFGQVVILN
uniref:cAMP responsive element modulator n=1 Tax=Esox lucius TaxID=8010 RepID=A0AAY5KKN4_ESOLU